MNILVIGAGSFGTAIANELSSNNLNNVLLFSKNLDKVNEINQKHTNKTSFPNKQISDRLRATNSKKDISNADVIFIALPSSIIIDYLLPLDSFFSKDVLFVNLSKGLLESATTIVEKIKILFNTDNVVTLKGPSFSSEVIEHADTLLTLGYSTKKQYDIISAIIQDT